MGERARGGDHLSFGIHLDENFQDRVLVRLLRTDGVDCLTSNEARNGELSDEHQLEFATAQSRTIVTHDKGDFQRLHGAWMAADRSHSGILIVTNVRIPTSELHSRLVRLQAERDAAQMLNAILFLGPTPLEEYP